jgi:hypothetical protein
LTRVQTPAWNAYVTLREMGNKLRTFTGTKLLRFTYDTRVLIIAGDWVRVYFRPRPIDVNYTVLSFIR